MVFPVIKDNKNFLSHKTGLVREQRETNDFRAMKKENNADNPLIIKTITTGEKFHTLCNIETKIKINPNPKPKIAVGSIGLPSEKAEIVEEEFTGEAVTDSGSASNKSVRKIAAPIAHKPKIGTFNQKIKPQWTSVAPANQ